MAVDKGERTPILEEEGRLRQRNVPAWPKSRPESEIAKFPIEWNPELPYGGRVYLPRRKKPDPWWVIVIEVRHTNSNTMIQS